MKTGAQIFAGCAPQSGRSLPLLSIYNEDGKRGLTENINAALPFMDEDMRELAKRTLAKIAPLTENEYAELAIFAADEV